MLWSIVSTLYFILFSLHLYLFYYTLYRSFLAFAQLKHSVVEMSVTVAPYFLLFFVFLLPALIATVPHTWLSHGRHAETTRLSCSAHSASFASQITGYLVTQPFWTLVHVHHLSHQSHVTRWSVRSAFCINTGLCCFS
jgi:hypothetical protein